MKELVGALKRQFVTREESPNPFRRKLPIDLTDKRIKELALFYDKFNPNRIDLDKRIASMYWWIVEKDGENVQAMMDDLLKKHDAKNHVDWAKCQMVLSCMDKVEKSSQDSLNKESYFPTDFTFLNIADTWKSAEMKQVEIGENGESKKANFMIFDLNLADSWLLKVEEIIGQSGGERSGNTRRIGESLTNFMTTFMETYFKYRSNIAKDVPMKIAVPIPEEIMNDTEIIPIWLKSFLKKESLTREEISGLNYTNIDKINKAFLVDANGEKLLRDAKKVNVRVHGWTGNKNSSVNEETLKQLAALGKDAIGIYPSGLGIDQSLKDRLGKKKMTTPEDYAKELMTFLDFSGIWGKNLFLNGHSMGGAAMYWLTDEIIKRMEIQGFKNLPQIHIFAENPALKDTCIFLIRRFDKVIQGLGDFAHATSISRILPGVVEWVTEHYTKFLAPQTSAKEVRPYHVQTYLDDRESNTIQRQTLGLIKQPDLPKELVERINQAISNGRLSFIAMVGKQDNITSAEIQQQKFKEYGLKHLVLSFLKAGHFTHTEPLYTKVMSYLFQLYDTEKGPISNNTLITKLREILSTQEKTELSMS